jgi:hypothetical protein
MDYLFRSRVPNIWCCYLAHRGCAYPSLTTTLGHQETPKDAGREQTTVPVLGTSAGTERYGLRASRRRTPYIPSTANLSQPCLNHALDAPGTLDVRNPPTQTQQLAPPRQPTNLHRIHETPLQARNIPPHRLTPKLPKPLRNPNLLDAIEQEDLANRAFDIKPDTQMRFEFDCNIKHARRH